MHGPYEWCISDAVDSVLHSGDDEAASAAAFRLRYFMSDSAGDTRYYSHRSVEAAVVLSTADDCSTHLFCGDGAAVRGAHVCELSAALQAEACSYITAGDTVSVTPAGAERVWADADTRAESSDSDTTLLCS